MKKPCPDLVHLDDASLKDFWSKNRPENLKNLGDRLLTESLPRFEPRGEEFYLQQLTQIRETAGKSVEQMAHLFGLNPAILEAWENGSVRAPASLSLIYRNL